MKTTKLEPLNNNEKCIYLPMQNVWYKYSSVPTRFSIIFPEIYVLQRV